MVSLYQRMRGFFARFALMCGALPFSPVGALSLGLANWAAGADGICASSNWVSVCSTRGVGMLTGGAGMTACAWVGDGTGSSATASVSAGAGLSGGVERNMTASNASATPPGSAIHPPLSRDDRIKKLLDARGGLRGRWWCCVKKARERHAVGEMKEDPSEPSCRGGLQTAMSCFGQKLR